MYFWVFETSKKTFKNCHILLLVIFLFLVSPVLAPTLTEMDLIEGNDLIISCIVLMGNPKPTTKWYKNGVEIDQRIDSHTEVSVFEINLCVIVNLCK